VFGEGFFVELGVVAAVWDSSDIYNQPDLVGLKQLSELVKRSRRVPDGENCQFGFFAQT